MPEIDEPTPGNDSVNELYVKVAPKHILYTDGTGRLPIRDRSSNQYLVVAYHSSNIILVEPFSSRKDKRQLAVYNAIMQRLKKKIYLLTYTFWAMNVARSTKQPLKTSGEFSSNYYLLTCTGAMQQNELFKHLKLISSPSFLA